MSYKEKIIGLISVLVFIFITYTIYKNKNKTENDIKLNEYTSVCKVFKIDSRRSFTHANYYYYYNNVKYQSWESIDKPGDEVLNKFYQVNISTLNPENSKINLDIEVKNLNEIKKAGFKY